MTTRSSERTILVVEDQPEVLSLLADALQMVGYRVLTAAHPDDGLAIGDEHAQQIDLVLTDVVMPGMNGPEMAQRLVFRHPFLRVLYLSGYDRETLRPLGVPVDGPAFLKKPFTLDVLVERVSGALCR
jgi:two-component system cell cycle sensor histidine kinase/response regulator CckA